MPTGHSFRALIVEVHDVSPATWPEVQRILALLGDLRITTPTLLVVPRHETANPPGLHHVRHAHQVHDLRDYPRLVDALRARASAGSELVLHGLTHRAPGPPPSGVKHWLMHHWFSRGEAEFAHLERGEAAWRLREGRRLLAACGLRAQGFIAPAWQQSPGAFQAVVEAGFAFTAFLGRVVPLTGRREPLSTPALTFCAPTPWVDHPKRWVMRSLEAAAHGAPLLRVALHPEDARVPGRLAHIATRLEALSAERRLLRYLDWLAETENDAPVGAARGLATTLGEVTA